MPSREDLMLAGGAGVVGFLESQSKKDTNFFLNKIPRPIAQIGWMGNTALILHVANHFFPNQYLRLGKRAALMLATYQLARKGSAFSKGDEFFSISGDDYLSGDEAFLDDHTMGALEAEADIAGLSHEDVENALAHT